MRQYLSSHDGHLFVECMLVKASVTLTSTKPLCQTLAMLALHTNGSDTTYTTSESCTDLRYTLTIQSC